ncbi:MAG: hypothetical protein ACTSXY_12655 [Promethearchaeota archaeon]
MKRKPIDIIVGLLNILNSFQTNREYNINEIKQKTGFHWQTISDYVLLIQLIQEFGTKIKINPKTNKIRIISPSNYFRFLTLEEQIITFLFIEKAFNESNSISEDILLNFFRQNQIKTIKDSPFIKTTFNNTIIRKNNTGFYLTRRGNFKAQGILASINRKMVEFIDKKANVEFTLQSNEIIKPYQIYPEIISTEPINSNESPELLTIYNNNCQDFDWVTQPIRSNQDLTPYNVIKTDSSYFA